MAKKDNQNRLLIPKDIWDVVCFSSDDILAFFLTNDRRVALASLDNGHKLGYEFMGKCNPDEKHRIKLLKDIDEYLGEGDFFYFTTPIMPPIIYIYKTSKEKISEQQNIQFGLIADQNKTE